MKKQFQLDSEQEFIPLDKLLKFTRLVGSGGEAHAVIQEGMVSVNGQIETQKRKKLRRGDVAAFNGESIIVE
jgi:ribosome-associated protein